MLVEANGANGATVREYVWFDDMPLAIVANVDTASPQLLHVHADHLDRPIIRWSAMARTRGSARTDRRRRNMPVPQGTGSALC